MFIRIFKTILLFNLCIALSIYNYAAVSVADGTAFVTKAEFTADLNNLSNRMAQLENSLDATIDSLVSSYLTRNVIWNGAKQDIKTGGYIINIAASGQEPIYALHNPPTFVKGDSFTWLFADNIFGNAELFTANKSGLLALAVSTYGAYNTTTKTFSTDNRTLFAYSYGYKTGEMTWLKASTGGCYVGWELVDSSGNIKTALSLGSATPAERTDGSTYTGDTVNNIVTTMMFTFDSNFAMLQCFLNKGDVIYQRLRYKMNMSGDTDIDFITDRSYTEGYNMVIDYCNIY